MCVSCLLKTVVERLEFQITRRRADGALQVYYYYNAVMAVLVVVVNNAVIRS